MTLVKLDDAALVTVCSACHRASCLQGVLLCKAAPASTARKTVAELRAIGREGSAYWRSEEP